MRNSPFTRLFLAVSIFAIVSLVFAHFRHGFNVIGLAPAFIGMLLTASLFYDVLVPDEAHNSVFRRLISLLDVSIAGLATAFALFRTFDIATPTWLMPSFFILCVCKAPYFWFQYQRKKKQKNTMDPLQMRMIEKSHDHDA